MDNLENRKAERKEQKLPINEPPSDNHYYKYFSIEIRSLYWSVYIHVYPHSPTQLSHTLFKPKWDYTILSMVFLLHVSFHIIKYSITRLF